MSIAGKWRVIIDNARHGALNMAIDEAIVQAHTAGLVPPTLRFYSWQPPALSIGYFQKIREEVEIAACREQGIDLIRRTTGGRAVLHDRELTYSAVVREDNSVLPPTLLGSYRYLSQGLIAGLNKLGVNAEMTLPGAAFGQSGRLPKNGACFDAPSFYEITVDRKKLIGSAQVRKHGTLLQHGSILLDFSAGQVAGLLAFTSEEERTRCQAILQTKATSLNRVLGYIPDSGLLAQTLAVEFGRELGLEMVPGALTDWEFARAAELEKDKFSADDWTYRR
ncbi:lipoate--protein ligase family protein [Anaerospora hongkongensis]|uniref:lipoate--protein ligase family protein n=1 Tax=Anaerospora hongkongensis TaxID=244830 RepID=UPI00289FD3E6|nr:lipoate--protein ligase family protein [Anaerospora hongkongensis]